MANELIIPEFSKQDYLTTTKPFEWLQQFKDNKLKLKQMMTMLGEKAGAVGVKNFVTLYRMYLETINEKNNIANNVTDFEGQEIELECGQWYADDLGVTGTDKLGFEVVACNHPILPIQRLINIDTGVEKLKLAYKKNKQWRHIIADKKTLASNNSILQLADFGIAVNSENSKYLVKYLTDIEHLNYEKIQELNSVGRLGWIEEYGFSPYVEELVFDGDLNFKNFFESVKSKGSYIKWLEIVREIRQKGICARLMLASSFASVLVGPCSALPFFVHLWGGTEAGKTVGLMLAASVWANPEMGRYIHTFNSTSVALELSAGFVNSLPLIIDELQVIKEKKDFDQLIYQLCEGVGRSRGQKTGGLQKLATWQNCILTTGEMPIGSTSSGAGAVNRIIEIDCKDTKLFDNPAKVADTIKKNYGFAGKIFVEKLQKEKNMQYAKEVQKDFYKKLTQGTATEKQALSASIILTADKLIDEWIFNDGMTLQIPQIEQYLSNKNEVSANERALSYLYDFISINQNKFRISAFSETTGEVWGIIEKDCTFIIKTQFDKILREEGYNPTAFLSWAKSKGIVDGGDSAVSRNTVSKRIQGSVCRCVKLQNYKETVVEMEDVNIDELPF